MKTKQWITIAAVVTLSATVAGAAPHGGGEGRHGRSRGREMRHRFVQKLNLTDAQQQQMRAIRESFKERNRDFFATARATREQFREARKANDTARLEALKPQMQSQREQMKEFRKQQHEQVLAILTAGQRAQLESMKAQRAQRRNRR